MKENGNAQKDEQTTKRISEKARANLLKKSEKSRANYKKHEKKYEQTMKTTPVKAQANHKHQKKTRANH